MHPQQLVFTILRDATKAGDFLEADRTFYVYEQSTVENVPIERPLQGLIASEITLHVGGRLVTILITDRGASTKFPPKTAGVK